MKTISTQDNMIFDMMALFDEQFDVVDFKNAVDENKYYSDLVLHKTKESIDKAIHNTEKKEDKVKYVVDMDDELLDMIEKGELKLVTGKDGSVFAQLRNSNGQFGEKLPIKKELEEYGITVGELQIAMQLKTIEEQLNIDEGFENHEPKDEAEEFYLYKSIAGLKLNQSAQNPITYL